MWKKAYEYDMMIINCIFKNMSKKSRGARMRLTGIHIKSFRAIRDVTIDSVENALILVDKIIPENPR